MIDKFVELINRESNKKVFWEEVRKGEVEKTSIRLIKAFNKAYESDGYVDLHLCEEDEGLVLVPALIRSKKSRENIYAGIVVLSMYDSGEHIGTDIYTDAGIIDVHSENDYIKDDFFPYEYQPLIYVDKDIHIDYDEPCWLEEVVN